MTAPVVAMMLGYEALYRYVGSRPTRGGLRLLHTENPLSCLLETVLYLSVGYLLAGKLIRALLRQLSLKQHARESCAEALLLGASAAVCLFLCWTELRPRRDVHRRGNSLTGVFTHNRLFDEYNAGADSTNGRAVFALVSALLLHAAGVTWYNQGLDLQVVKKTSFFAFYVAAHNLRFKCLGSAATMIVTLTELLLQLTRVVCCFERQRPQVPILTYLSFATYLTAWTAVFVGVFPWFILRPCLHFTTPLAKLPPMCLLSAALFAFYVIELVTMPLLELLWRWLLVTPSLVSCGRLERVLIPPPARVLRELGELHARKRRAQAAQREFDIRHGSCKKTRDAYKSLKMIMVVKRRIRNFRAAKLPAGPQDTSTSTPASEPSGNPPDVTACQTRSDLHWSHPPVIPLRPSPSHVNLAARFENEEATDTSSDLDLSSTPVNTASETLSDLHLSSTPVNTASETLSDLHLSSTLVNTASETLSDLHLSSTPVNTASETLSNHNLSATPVNTASETPDEDTALTTSSSTGGAFKSPPSTRFGSLSDPPVAIECVDETSGEFTGWTL